MLALMLSASAIGRFFNTVSILATMCFVGIFPVIPCFQFLFFFWSTLAEMSL